MKKNLFGCLLIIYFMSLGATLFSNFNDSNTKIGLGTKHYRIIKKLEGHKHTSSGTLFGAEASYKHQKPKHIYFKAKISYYQGFYLFKTTIETAPLANCTGNYKERASSFAIGYTFPLYNQKLLISPFICLEGFYDTSFIETFDKTTEERIFTKRRYRGIAGKIGLDTNYKITKNTKIAIIASIGSTLNSNRTYSGSEGNFYEKNKRRLCYEIIIPLIYVNRNFLFGLELNHARRNFNYENPLNEYKQTFGANFLFGWQI